MADDPCPKNSKGHTRSIRRGGAGDLDGWLWVHRLQAAGNMFSVFFTGSDVTNYDEAKTQ